MKGNTQALRLAINQFFAHAMQAYATRDGADDGMQMHNIVLTGSEKLMQRKGGIFTAAPAYRYVPFLHALRVYTDRGLFFFRLLVNGLRGPLLTSIRTVTATA